MATRPITFSVTITSTYDRWGSMEAIGEAAKLADQAGIHAIEFGEHIVRPLLDDGTAPAAGVVWYDTFVMASYLAAITKRIRLMTSVLVLPYRPPVLTAKLVSTLDTLSRGRVTLGIGSGALAPEFKALGIPFEERGPMTDEYLKIMRVLWTQDRPSFKGRYANFANIAFEPKCVQTPHVPIWIGGVGPPALRRVAEFGNGWVPNHGTLDFLAENIKKIKGMARAAGRNPDSLDFAFRLRVGEIDERMEAVLKASHGASHVFQPAYVTPDEVINAINHYRSLGLTHLLLMFNWRNEKDYMNRLEWLAKHILPAFREAPVAAGKAGGA